MEIITHEPFSPCLKARVQPILRWAGGKYYLAKTLCEFIPEHEVYVEPFAGGASLFFAKQPVPKEVLSDINCDLIDFYKTFRKLKSIEELLHHGWFPFPKRFEQCKTCIQDGECQHPKAYCFLFLNKFAYGGKTGRYSPNPAKIERCREKGKYCEIKNVVRSFEVIKDRLKNVVFLCEDFRTVIPRYDSPKTFFYLDPPYYKTSDHNDFYVQMLEPEPLYDVIKKIRGKFLLTYNDHPLIRKLFGKYVIEEKQARYRMSGKNTYHINLLIRNYN